MKAVELAKENVEAVRMDVESTNASAESEAKSAGIDGSANSRTLSDQKVEYAKLSGNLKIKTAEIELDKAESEVTIAASKMGVAKDKLKAAETDVRIAEVQNSRLETDLKNAQLKSIIQVPADEIVFSRSFPLRIQQLKINQGDFSSGSIMVVTDSHLVVDSAISIDDAKLIHTGMKVDIDEADLGIKSEGVISKVAAAPGTNKVDGYHIYFEVTVNDKNIVLDGISVRLTIPLKSTGGAVTAVPVSALTLATDGSSRIQVKRLGELKFVTVVTGLVADGYAEVTTENEKLQAGDLIVIGFSTSLGEPK